jgi:leucine dehydrogenase
MFQIEKTSSLDKLLQYAESIGFGEIHFKLDPQTGLIAIIAVHSTTRGPAIGGARCLPYNSSEDALKDVLNLAQMMSYKAAACGLPHGGAKAVLIRPEIIKDREAYFKSFGQFVNSLNGRYVTAVDSGTTSTDMDIVATQTNFVTSVTSQGDPSPLTALGVRRGIEAAVLSKMNKDSLEGIHVAIQGVGHVGYYLAKDLHERGAHLTITDINPVLIERCVKEFNAHSVAPDDIYKVEADIFSPCALGGTINAETIKKLQVKIVAGSANNQLAHPEYGQILNDHGILYAPDFVINSGGLIHVAAIYDHGNEQHAHQQIMDLYDTLLGIFSRAKAENKAPSVIADQIAVENLKVPAKTN